jgi:N-hydroxyarylamine O-acetyltransferase
MKPTWQVGFFIYVGSMDIQRYLSRIKFEGSLSTDLITLKKLHRQHLLHVPFEDLDIHFDRRFDLEPINVYHKIVIAGRGGFCYEVNSLFNDLLKTAGFKTRIISGHVINDKGVPGPEYDHMAIVVELGKNYIVDVGFGDLFIEPLEMSDHIQFDGRNYFQIKRENDEYSIWMSPTDLDLDFRKKYIFTLTEVPIRLFEEPCYEKQTNPDSHFVKNTICTKITDLGRITIYNDKFIETIGDTKMQTMIRNDDELKEILRVHFGIVSY